MEAAQFRAMREAVGASQYDVAAALRVTKESVKKWEKGEHEIPEEAGQLIAGWFNDFLIRVETAYEIAAEAESVTLRFYRTQADYDKYGRDSGAYGFVNAVTIAVGTLLSLDGVDVKYEYPTSRFPV